MSTDTSASLEQQAHRVFELIDSVDTDALAAMITDDAQGVDEISRGWMRGRERLEAYFGQLKGTVEDVHTEIRDMQVSEAGDAGVVTFVMDQTYKLEGAEQSITAPTTLVFRREGGEWKLAVFHTVPLPE